MTPVTEDRLQEILDKRFAAFEVKLDRKIERMFEAFEQRIDAKIEQQFAIFFGKITKYIDEKIDAELAPIRKDIRHIHITLDYLVKRAEIEEQERVIMYGQLDRHDRWFKELAASTDTRLSKA